MNDLSPKRHDKFKAYRQRKKSEGLREIRLWAPDVHSPEFLTKLKKDMQATSIQEDEQDVMIFLERATEELWSTND